MKFNFDFEYDGNIIGFVVTNESGQTANLQFDYNPSAPHEMGVSFACEGDETYKNFSENELEEALNEALHNDDVLFFQALMKDIHLDPELKKELDLLSLSGYIFQAHISMILRGMTYRNGYWNEPAL